MTFGTDWEHPKDYIQRHTDLPKIVELAKEKGWQVIDHQEDIYMISFWKPKTARINVYYSKMTVATALEHPTKGKTQLYRRGVGWKLLGKIFDNPRVHTPLGYREKPENKK